MDLDDELLVLLASEAEAAAAFASAATSRENGVSRLLQQQLSRPP